MHSLTDHILTTLFFKEEHNYYDQIDNLIMHNNLQGLGFYYIGKLYFHHSCLADQLEELKKYIKHLPEHLESTMDDILDGQEAMLIRKERVKSYLSSVLFMLQHESQLIHYVPTMLQKQLGHTPSETSPDIPEHLQTGFDLIKQQIIINKFL